MSLTWASLIQLTSVYRNRVLNLGPETRYTDIFRDFHQSLKENCGILPSDWSTSFRIHNHPVFEGMQAMELRKII
jgi:hypothetical protein